MAEYYTLDTVRNQILQNGWSVNSVYFATGNQRTYEMAENFPPDWKYCPCITLVQCTQRKTGACFLRIGITTDDSSGISTKPNTSLFIEIIFLRENHAGIVRKNQTLLQSHIEAGRIKKSALKTIVV